MINQIPSESLFCNDYTVENQCPCFDNFGHCRLWDKELEIAPSVDHNWSLYSRSLECRAAKPCIKVKE